MNILKSFLIKSYLLSALCVVLGVSTVLPMDPPREETEDIFVKTSDGAIVRVERWQISQMKTLLVLLEHQQGENSYDNPINASMIHSDELAMLKFALRASAEQVFEQYFLDLAKNDGLLDQIEDKGPKFTYTLGEGRLRALVNAAERVEAQGIVGLCGSYYLPKEMQNILVSYIINPVMVFLKDRVIKSAEENALNIGSDASGNKAQCCAFSHDSKNIYVGFDAGKIEVWELASGKLLKSFGTNELRDVKQIALSSDDTICAAELAINDVSGEIAIWDTFSGELLHKYPNNRGGHLIKSMVFNPLDKNQIIFGYSNEFQVHLPPYAFYLNIANGVTTPLRGYDKGINTLCFSPDGTKILGKSWRFLDNIAIWDATNGNLLHSIRPRWAQYCTAATFYGSSDKIMMAGSSHGHGEQGQLIIEIGSIKNNNYVMEKSFTCDRFFSSKKHDFSYWGFLAEPSFDTTKVALCTSYDLNQPEYSTYGTKKYPGSLMYICKNDFKSPLFSTYLFETGVGAIAWSPNDGWVAVTTQKGKILLLPILTEKNEAILNQLPSLSIAQARLLYQLYCGRLSGLRLGIKETEKDNAVFMEIPLEMRGLLLKHLLYDRPTGKEEGCIGNECVIL